MSPLATSFFYYSILSSVTFAVLTLLLFIRRVKLKSLTPGVNLKNIAGLASRTAHSSLAAGVEEHEEVDGSPPPPFVPLPPPGWVKPIKALPFVTVKGVEPKLPVSIFHTKAFWVVGGSVAFIVGILAYFFVFA